MIKKKQKLMKKLNTAIKKCTDCQLSSTRNHVLTGEEDIHSRIMLVALSPGEKENECKWFPTCPIKRFYQQGRIDQKWIELYCKGDWKSCTRYAMEEKGKPHPDYMLPDGSLDKRLE